MKKYPKVKDPKMVGEYPASSKAGGGYVWDEVLEYRVWCYPRDGAPDLAEESDYYYAFETCEEAFECSNEIEGAQNPLALILQAEHIDEPEPDIFEHKKENRMTEWPVEFLSRPRRTPSTIPDFMSPNAPENKLDIIRGLSPKLQ